MKENYLENKVLSSAYILSSYLLILGIFNYFYSSYFFFLDEFPNAQDSARSAFLIGGAFLIFQIYNTSKELYHRLIDTFIVLQFTLTMVYPVFCVLKVFIFEPFYLIFVFIHFCIICLQLYDKNK